MDTVHIRVCDDAEAAVVEFFQLVWVAVIETYDLHEVGDDRVVLDGRGRGVASVEHLTSERVDSKPVTPLLTIEALADAVNRERLGRQTLTYNERAVLTPGSTRVVGLVVTVNHGVPG